MWLGLDRFLVAVKGHAGNDGNHKADRLANIAVEEKIIGYAEVVIKDQV